MLWLGRTCHMLLKVILKPIKKYDYSMQKIRSIFQISSKILGFDFFFWKWDFVFIWPIAVTCSIFDIRGSSFGLSALFMCYTNHVWQVRLLDQFLIFFLVPPSEEGWGKKFQCKCCLEFLFLYLGEVKKFQYNRQSHLGVRTNLWKGSA